jgi:hypothetical protein
VLDSKPFLPAIDAIRERPAGLEVDRRLLYLEPDPGDPKIARQTRSRTQSPPRSEAYGPTRAEPILDDLVEVGG